MGTLRPSIRVGYEDMAHTHMVKLGFYFSQQWASLAILSRNYSQLYSIGCVEIIGEGAECQTQMASRL
jgi:hypothetical protein